MMPNLTRMLPALFAIVLINAFITGCVQKKAVQPDTDQPKVAQPVAEQPETVGPKKAQSEGCRSCHAPNAAAEDFSSIYDNPQSHHPIGVRYPDAAAANFSQPDGWGTGVAFFDRNGNGLPDSDEIMLFGTTEEVTVECASCHKEHGDSPISAKGSAGFYLRVENAGSAMCTACHQY